MQCLTYCVAAQIDLVKLEREAYLPSDIIIEKNWRVLGLVNKSLNSCCYVFANGTVVGWNLTRYQMLPYLEWIKPHCSEKLKKILFEGFSYRYDSKTIIKPHRYFNVDCLTLEADDAELRLSLSYGLSQSIKLKFYEDMLEGFIVMHTPLFQELSEKGELKISRQAVRKIIGNILRVKGDLNLVSNFLYTPKFFWQHPNLEIYFTTAEHYLDMAGRARTLNQQLNTLNEIFHMFNTYLETRYSHHLELIIILLIALEFLFYILDLHL